jgi:tRNA(Ile)-lysidine synthase
VTRVDPLCLRLERRVAIFVAEHGVLLPGESVVLMLSGGADSMALLALVRAADRRLGLGLRLAAVHVDYRARGRESDRDRGIVERACGVTGVPLHALRLERPLGGAAFQERAREVRYRYAREVAAQEGAGAVVTGHNRDDQAETVLYRLAKYASPRGLVGMRPRDGDLARPLLCVGAAEVRDYCRAAGIEFGDDRTNASAAYARNALRLEVLPRLQAVNPRVAETLAAAALQAGAEADVLRGAVAEARRRVAAAGGAGGAAVDVAALAAELPAVRALVLHDLVRKALGGDALVERRLVEALLALAARPGGRVRLGRGLEAAREGGLLVVRAAAPPHRCAPVTLAADRLPCGASAAGGATATAGRPVAFCSRCLSLALLRGPVFERAAALAGEGFVGLAAPPAGVTVRHPRRGERFAPSGLGCETTVARFLAAQRVPPEQRARAVVLDVDGVAAWLAFPGAGGRHSGRVAQPFRVDESTVCTLQVKLEEA